MSLKIPSACCQAASAVFAFGVTTDAALLKLRADLATAVESLDVSQKEHSQAIDELIACDASLRKIAAHHVEAELAICKAIAALRGELPEKDPADAWKG